MNKQYEQLFTELAHATELLAERALELNNKNADEKGIKAAQTMRENYAELYDCMKKKSFDFDSLARKDYAQLLISAVIAVRQLEKNKEDVARAISGYKVDLIPKLERLVNETKTDDEVKILAKQLFAEEEKSNS